jgi:hypothetical protein
MIAQPIARALVDILDDLFYRFVSCPRRRAEAERAPAAAEPATDRSYPRLIIWSRRELTIAEGYLMHCIQMQNPAHPDTIERMLRFLVLRSDGTLKMERLMEMPLDALPALFAGAMEAYQKGASERKAARERMEARHEDRIRRKQAEDVPDAFKRAWEAL